MILIDDAGWGSLIGGVLYGVCRVETGEFLFDEVHPRFFHEPLFSAGAYQKEAALLVGPMLDELRVPSDESICICTGSCLEGIRSMLGESDFSDWQTAKIGEPLQTKIETAFQKYLAAFGFHIDLETLTQKQGLAFHKAVAWLHGGNAYHNPKSLPEREAVCKTGWASFRVWADNPYPVAKELAQRAKAHRNRELRPW